MLFFIVAALPKNFCQGLTKY